MLMLDLIRSQPSSKLAGCMFVFNVHIESVNDSV